MGAENYTTKGNSLSLSAEQTRHLAANPLYRDARAVVRRFGSNQTHVLTGSIETDPATSHNVPYAAVSPRGDHTALCGVNVAASVVMRHGTKVRCPACRHLSGATESGGDMLDGKAAGL